MLFYGEIRKYTVVATRDSELYVLNKKDFKQVFLMEFRNIGEEIVDNAYSRKIRAKKVYKEAVDFVKSLDNTDAGIKSRIATLNNMLRKVDQPVWQHLRNENVNP